MLLATSDAPAADGGSAAVLRCADEREWFGLFEPLSQLPEQFVGEPLADLEKRLHHWYEHGEASCLWTPPAPPEPAPGKSEAPSSLVAPSESEESSIEDELLVSIRTGIAEGSFEIGDELSDRVLADRLGAGQGRVRRGMHALAEEGLITVTAENSVAVRLPTKADVVEMYAARQALGTIALRSACRRGTAGAREARAALDALAECIREGDTARTQRLDAEFQTALAQMSGLSRIPGLIGSFAKQLVMFITLMGPRYAYPTGEILEQDAGLLASVLEHDQDRAVAIWREKMGRGAEYMLDLLDEPRTGPRGLV
ncbi:Transcriptional regulator, GntR family [Gulosibacter sp. 10]|nr:Transcriptional regulator, GntR family [Gulosibacter sp. 10]